MTEEQKDVKQEETKVATSAIPTEAPVVKEEAAPSFEELVGENKTIPYAVFKERNEKLRETERKLKTLEKQIDSKVNEAVTKTAEQYRAWYESQLMNAQPQQQIINPYDYAYSEEQKPSAQVSKLEAEIKALRDNLSSLDGTFKERELKSTIDQLKTIYPMMDEEHVYALKKIRPEIDLDEAAKYSHDKFQTYTKGLYDKMIESKKQAAKIKVVGAESKSIFKMDKKPKNFKEAKAFAQEYLSNLGE